MENVNRSETGREEWVTVGIDDDGTEAYLDSASIVRDLEATTLFKVCLKHVPPQGSKAYAEIVQVIKAAKKDSGKPGHVKQVVEIDFARDMSRNLHLIVCDNQGGILDVINFRYPDWANIERGSIIDKVREALFSRFPDATGGHREPLKFSPPRVHLKPDHVEISNRYRIAAQPSVPSGKMRLEEIDL
jgi:hypothetical protein